MMKIQLFILATTLVLGSTAMAQDNDEARARGELGELGERGEGEGERGEGERDEGERDEGERDEGERGEGEGGEGERDEGERDEGAEPNETAEARAQRAMKAASKIMTDAGKLKAKQATELYAIVFPEDIDWDAKYEAYLKENPGVARAVDSGKITKEKVMAGIKARSGEKAPTEEEQLEALYHKLLKDEPNLGRTPKVDLMPRLKRMLERGEGKNLRPEKTTRQRGMTFGLYFNNLIESGQVERSDKDMQLVFDIGASEISRQEEGEREDRVGERRIDEERRDRTDGEAKYKAYLEENPSVAKAVETGKISKEKVMAGIKARAAEGWEAKLKRFWEYEKRDDPRRWVGKTFEQVRRELEEMLRYEGDDWEHDNEEDQRERDERRRDR